MTPVTIFVDMGVDGVPVRADLLIMVLQDQ